MKLSQTAKQLTAVGDPLQLGEEKINFVIFAKKIKIKSETNSCKVFNLYIRTIMLEKKRRPNLFRWFRLTNIALAVMALSGGIYIIIQADHLHIPAEEQILYGSFLATFSVAFLLFSTAISGRSLLTSSRGKAFLLGNGFVLAFFIGFAFFLTYHLNQDRRLLLDPELRYARIYRVDPGGYQKQRTIYFTFEHEDQRIQQSLSTPDTKYHIGDTIPILFSRQNPNRFRLLSSPPKEKYQ